MAKAIRFFFYGIIALFVVAFKSTSLKVCYAVLTQTNYYFDDYIFLILNLVVSLFICSYVIWLSGATFLGWRMPLWSHAVPLLLMFFVMWEQGWILRPVSEHPRDYRYPETHVTPVNRAMDAMSRLARLYDEKPCFEVTTDQIADYLGEAKYNGYSNHGFMNVWTIAYNKGDEPVTRLPMGYQSVGELFVVCNPSDGGYHITAVISDSLPTGNPVFVVDGVGKPVSVSGRYADSGEE